MLVGTERTEWTLGKSLKKLKFSVVDSKVDIDVQRALGVHVVFALKQHRSLACLVMSEPCDCLSCLVLGLLLRAMPVLTASHSMNDNAGSSENGRRVACARPKAMQLWFCTNMRGQEAADATGKVAFSQLRPGGLAALASVLPHPVPRCPPEHSHRNGQGDEGGKGGPEGGKEGDEGVGVFHFEV